MRRKATKILRKCTDNRSNVGEWTSTSSLATQGAYLLGQIHSYGIHGLGNLFTTPPIGVFR